MSFLRPVQWLLLHRKIGPVVICIKRVMRDVVNVFIVFAIIYIAFSVGLWSMFKPFQNCKDSLYCIKEEKLTKNKGFQGVMSLLFWKVFDGDFSSAEVFVNKNHSDFKMTNMNSGEEFSLDFSHLMGLTFFAVYQGLTVIILINILIAMMNSTYSRVWENSDKEWKYSKTYFQVKVLFNIFLLIRIFVGSVHQASRGISASLQMVLLLCFLHEEDQEQQKEQC